MKKNTRADRVSGVLFGLAYGDALGRPTEFIKADRLAKIDPFRDAVGVNRPQMGIATDDTQMSIAVARAALADPTPKSMTVAFTREFIRWFRDPKSKDGKRAPGATCLSAVGAMAGGRVYVGNGPGTLLGSLGKPAMSVERKPQHWMQATVPGSKGNGANMRVAPLALRTDWTWEQMAGAAQLQAAMTHGHPTAAAAAHLTAYAVRLLLEDVCPPGESLVDMLMAYALAQRHVYRAEWLGPLWEQWPGKTPVYTPQEFIARGWMEVYDALGNIYGMPRNGAQDPCDVGGEGWTAEEALAVAVHTLLCFPDDPADALRRAAFTGGDSDSIASITGALVGAVHGRRGFPKHWVGNLEYRAQLDSLSARLVNAAHC